MISGGKNRFRHIDDVNAGAVTVTATQGGSLYATKQNPSSPLSAAFVHKKDRNILEVGTFLALFSVLNSSDEDLPL